MKLIPYLEGRYPSQPDPFILKGEDGCYYIYSTSIEGVHAYRADSLLGNYEDIGVVFSVPGGKEYWAPSVIYTQGKYYMYVSFMPAESDDVHQQAMHVAESDTPCGPFTKAEKLLEPFSIDSHVVENEAGLFIFYSINDYEADRAGTYIVVDKMENPRKVCGNPVAVVRPTLDEEIFQRNRFRQGQHWHTLEGACYFRQGDWHYVIYSGNCYENEYYFLGYAAACTPENDLTKIAFRKMPDDNTYAPLLSRNDVEEGTGHNSVIEVDGKHYIVYHGRDKVTENNFAGDQRTARICRMQIDNGVLTALRNEP